jgi:hypothetical protein
MFLLKTLSILILSFLLTLFLPWWGIALAAFIIGLIFSNKPGNNFLAGMLGVGLFWLGFAAYIDFRDEYRFSGRIAQLFSDSLHTDINSWVLLMFTTFLGALIGGLSAMAGAMILDNGLRRKQAFKSGKYTLKIK